jgi:arsenate reductase (thioredoxin)
MVVRMDPEVWLDREIDRIADEFKGTFGAETIGRYVRESLDALEGSRVEDYVPIFVARFTRERLKALGQAEAILTKDRPEVLFVCVQNAGRSQMAAALMHHLGVGEVSVRSAGSAPASEVNSAVVAVMSELGLDLSMELPKPLTDEVVRAADVVITMGCGEACPVFPGAERRLHWSFPDPSKATGTEEQQLAVYRQVRDDIRAHVEQELLSGQ